MVRNLEERNELVVNNMSIVYYVIGREYSSYLRDEDMIQEACIGLINAADSWKPEIGCPFVVYAIITIKRAINNEIIKRSTQKRSSMLEISLYEKKPGMEDDTLEDTIPGSNGVDYFNTEEFLSLLTQNEINILRFLYDGYNKNEIAKIKNVSHQAISNTVHRIMRIWNSFYKETHKPAVCRKAV